MWKTPVSLDARQSLCRSLPRITSQGPFYYRAFRTPLTTRPISWSGPPTWTVLSVEDVRLFRCPASLPVCRPGSTSCGGGARYTSWAIYQGRRKAPGDVADRLRGLTAWARKAAANSSKGPHLSPSIYTSNATVPHYSRGFEGENSTP